MDLSDFLTLISNTILLKPDRKQYFLSKAPLYSPELRQKMADIIENNSQKLIRFGEERTLKIQEERSEKIHQQFLVLEKEHQNEIDVAKKQLEKDLELLKLA